MNRTLRFTPERGLLLTTVITAALYWRDLSYDFLLDDVPLIMMNPTITSWRNWKIMLQNNIFFSPYAPPGKSIHYRPLYVFWLTLNHQVFGMVLPWWHLTSLLLHLIATVLVYLLAVKFLKQRWLGVLAAGLFALHPIHTESVAYVTASTDLLVAVFFIAALLLYFRYREDGGQVGYLVASVCSAGAAMLCKESAGMIPWTLVAYEMLRAKPENEQPFWKRYVWTVPYFAVVAAYLAVRTLLFGPNAGPGPGGNRLAALADVPLLGLIYLKNLFFPTSLSFYYPGDWSAHWTVAKAFAVVLVLVATVMIWKRQTDHPEIRILLSWIAILFVPAVLTVTTFGKDEWVHDRHMYLTSIPFCILIAGLLYQLRLSKRALVLVSSGMILLLGVATYYQVPRFKDEVAVFASAVKVAPDNATMHQFYAQALWNYNLREQALEEYRTVIRLQPNLPDPYEQYATSLSEMGRTDEALVEFEKSLERVPARSPWRGHLLYRIANIESERSELDAAEAHLREAVAVAPEALNYHYALAEVLRKQGHPAEVDDLLRIEASNRKKFIDKTKTVEQR
jgi:hypothetical protein